MERVKEGDIVTIFNHQCLDGCQVYYQLSITSTQSLTILTMRFSTLSLSWAFTATALSAQNAVPSNWDGKCYYPTGDIGFELGSYLGKWYQVAGTLAPFTAGCKCIQAQYALNVSYENGNE